MSFVQRSATLQPADTWAGFELAASERYLDGLALHFQGQRTGAIYLWGYVAEMLLKAAVFKAAQFMPSQPIPRKGSVLGMVATLNHDIEYWADLLVGVRSTSQSPLDSLTEAALRRHASLVAANWSEKLRYKHVEATALEAGNCLKGVEWIMTNHESLSQ